ncbi:GATA transcription factor 7-like [Tasmannia lanceolata]|uniref:GATA transcription factor 7-like n=1 Tax=Tasmannia lanceolata TaxID=3420 RepID=UPI00406495D1
MESKALKGSSLRPEKMAGNEVFSDEVWPAVNGEREDFFVDDYFDFSNEDFEGFGRGDEEEEEEEKGFSGSSFSDLRDESSNFSVSVKEEFESELDVPTDDLANLEWLSHFVEDSFTEFPSSSDFLPTNKNRKENPVQTQNKNLNRTGFLTMETHIPAKARTKRSRTGSRTWSFSESASSSSPSSSSSSSSSSSCLIFTKIGQNPDLFTLIKKPPSKKPKPAEPVQPGQTGQTQSQRRCSHCLVQKTPQWRTGPLGSKTLCNACGVRFKSGRLLPEYRPAGSPTFVSDVHSNNHRKVIEMRRNKEISEPVTGLIPVQHFEI